MITYSQLLSFRDKVGGDLPKAIRKTAAEICERRRLRGQDLEAKANLVRQEKEHILKLIESLRVSLNACQDKEACKQIENLMCSLERELNSYYNDLDNLAQRFQNSKIRILSFGFKTQGKSLFTQLYTGIKDDQIVSVKGTTDADKTGATNVIHHNENYSAAAPHMVVYFRKGEELLSLLNNALKEVAPLLKGTRLPLNFATFTTFLSYINKGTNKNDAFEIVNSLEDSNHIASFDSAKSLLESFFTKVSDFTYVGQEPLELKGPSELSTFNDMQNPDKQCYLSVDHIDIAFDLQRDNMFENFEICDTKGLSEDAGGFLIEDALVEDINRADAVFSIQGIKQGGKMSNFVEKLKSLSDPKRKNGYIRNLEDRHFSIANIHSDINQSDVEAFEIKLLKSKLVHEVYAGMLVNGEFDGEHNDAKTFADCLILHMINEIVNTTQRLDAALLNACYQQAKEVNRLIQNLKQELQNLEVKGSVGYEDLLFENVRKLRMKIQLQLMDECSGKGISLDNTKLGETETNLPGKESSGTEDQWDEDWPEDEMDTTSSQNAGGTQAIDTSAYHSAHKSYDSIKAPNNSIYYMLTSHANDDVMDWDVDEEIRKAVEYLLSNEKILKKDPKFKTWYVDSDYTKFDKSRPVGDINSIGCALDALRYLFIKRKVSDNLEKYRNTQGHTKENEIASIYNLIFTELHFYDLYPEVDRNSFQAVKDCNVNNSAIQKLCDIARHLNLGDLDSYTWLPSSYKFMKEYFAIAPEPSSTDMAKSVIDFESVRKVYTKLLLECKNSMAAEIEFKDTDGQSPIGTCYRKVVDALDDSTIDNGLVKLYLMPDFSDEYLETLEKWDLLTAEDREEVRSGQKREELIQVKKSWESLSSVTAVS